MQHIIDRFLSYVTIDTESDPNSKTTPSTKKQLVLAKLLVKELKDINAREFLVMSLLAIAVLWMGVYPKPFTDVMDASVAQLLKHVAVSKLN